MAGKVAVPGTEAARGTQAKALTAAAVAGAEAGGGAGRLWVGGSMTRSLATRTLVSPMPSPSGICSAFEGFAVKRLYGVSWRSVWVCN